MGIYLYKLPDIGEGVVEAEITAWHVKVGDSVSEEDPIADAMTDKATIELTAPVDGIIKSVACEEGDILAVGGVLVELEVEGESNAEVAPEPAPKAEPVEEVTPLSTTVGGGGKPAAPQAPIQSAPTPRSVTTGKVLASPAVRKRADALGIDLAFVPAAGARLSHADLDAYLISGKKADTKPSASSASVAASTPTNEAVKDAPLLEGETRQKVIGLRRVIAQRMQAAKRHIPHFTYVEEIDMTALEEMRKRMNVQSSEDKPKLTVLPLLIRALSVTLEDWPQFNARYMDEAGYVSRFSDLNLGIATQTDGGLIVPVVAKANRLSIWQLAAEIARLAEAARTNTLDPKDLEGATTTLTSLGPLGGIVTTPVINRPEVAIFGPNKIRQNLQMVDGEIVARKVMNFSISCDHRVIDGYDAAAMIRDLKALLEDPQSIFLL
jgi:2-oxoisovalerate dehydrogenase E2 component (dihydrolipoyl transacylase)